MSCTAGCTDLSSPLLLVVDDEPVLRAFMAQVLEQHYRVLTAANGRQALAVFGTAREPIAGVVTDVQMPGLDGRAFAEAIRRTLDQPPPILFISGGRCSETLPGPFLAKPFHPDALVRAVA